MLTKLTEWAQDGLLTQAVRFIQYFNSLAWQFVLLAAVLTLSACHSRNHVPAKSSKAYTDTVSSFYTGLAALQVGDDVRAESNLARTTELAPGEAAGWVDWGILALRQRNFDAAAQRLERARLLTPTDDRVYYLIGLLESTRGNSPQAIEALQHAVTLNDHNIRATYQLALELERQADTGSQARFEQLIKNILVSEPGNLAALVELCRISAKEGDTVTLRQALARITVQSAAWSPEVQQQLRAVQAAASAPDVRPAATRTAFLRNVLMRVPEFRQSLSVLKPQPGEEAQPFTRFSAMESPPSTPAPADTSLTFRTVTLPGQSNQRWSWIGAVSLSGEGTPVIAEASAKQVVLSSGATFAFPGGQTGLPLGPEGVLAVDFNYDFKMDFALAGAGGLRLMRQDNPSSFADVTSATHLPDSILRGNYTGAWAVDIEADGDMDIVLGSTTGLPVVLRNNGDGTFGVLHPFSGVSGLTQFVWADLNADGNPDAAMLDGVGRLHVFYNQRSGIFQEQTLPSEVTQSKAITAADVNGDGVLDLICVTGNGTISRLSASKNSPSWTTAVLAKVPDATTRFAGELRVHVADLDNNGALDLILANVTPGRTTGGAMIWLGNQHGAFDLLPIPATPPLVFDIADLDNKGRLDLLGLSPDGQPLRSINSGTANYHWQILRPRARQATGDQRINSFGIGGEIEIRSGLLVQKQAITGPELHFGLGEQTTADVARIVWPNGSVRAEFSLKADQSILTEQRLKGSCPFLFAYNGKQMAFVKDAVPWGSAIGLRINSLGSADINATEEWYKIRDAELKPKDGSYDLRITGELWETYYYDYLALMTVDHPVGTEVYTDERFVVPAVKPAIITTSTPHQVVRATDDLGQDVTDFVRTLDGKYLDTFGRGQYQGITRDHYVEIDLGSDVPDAGPLWLIAKGWLHPSDSSINVAISQGSHEHPRGLSLEVPDGHGNWKVAHGNLGFPAGRNKTCLFDLTGLFQLGAQHRVRLRTNLEVYWDSIEWAAGLPDTPLQMRRIEPAVADLHYRGYSVISQQNASSPEIPDYSHLAATTQIWQDLSGYYTRYGDIKELLAKTDDRYAIMNAGDELALSFSAPPPPGPGWVRDFVIVGDGWIKDGDFNSSYSQTVLPLPHHSRKSYDSAPGELEDEWVYKQTPGDWQTYQTRYITSEPFRKALHNEAGR